VLPDPINVGLQCLGEPLGARTKVCGVIKKDEVKPPQRLGDRIVGYALANDWREPLIERGCVFDFFKRYVGDDGIRREHEHDGVGFADQRHDAFPPILEGIDHGAIDPRLEAARLKCLFELIREGDVFA
jgi:hypothetical protein